MIVALLSNWGSTACGPANFGRDWATALETAGQTVVRCDWDTVGSLVADRLLVNWDSGTLPADLSKLHGAATVFVHHTYRGTPSPLPEPPHVLLSPMQGYGTYFPYPISTHRASAPVVHPKTLGVTTLRKEGLDYLGAACARRGWTLCPPDRWRDTTEEIDRLSQCAALAAWYTNSPGRSLALATMLAAERPILLSTPSQMFEYAQGSRDIYWVSYTNQDVEPIAQALDLIEGHLQEGIAEVPRALAAAWSWPVAIRSLEALWTAA